jgi:hypothetical protein
VSEKRFEFEIYRLNVVEGDPTLFGQNRRFKGDQDILEILHRATGPEFKGTTSGKRATYQWAVRDYTEYEGEHEESAVSMTLARSLLTKEGLIVTDESIVEGLSEQEPPLADTVLLIFYLERHILLAERVSAVTSTGRWLSALEDILKDASRELEYSFSLEFEPIPRREEVLEAFRSFSRLTRIALKLRLPNPELSRYSEALYKEMHDGGIREYHQDMRNPKGLSQQAGHIPYAAVEIAQAGYKKGAIRMAGIRENRHETVETGRRAARGSTEQLRGFIRGMRKNAKSKEAKTAITAIIHELNRLVPPQDTEGQ